MKNIIFGFAALSACLLADTVHARVVPDSSPDSKTFKYEYREDDKPDVWFFPKDKARWDGYKVTNWNWMALSADQKKMFIDEGAAEIEKNKDATIKMESKWRILNAVTLSANTMLDQYSYIKKPMIDILLECLKDEGYIKFNSGNEAVNKAKDNE